jgi:ABC-type transport system involved in multi-copper enzyme maturation permease subunit
MFAACLRKELLHNVLSLRYLVVFTLFVVLTLACTVVRTGIYRQQVSDRAEVNSLSAECEARLHYWGQSKSFGVSVEKPPNPLSIFAYGLENELTRGYFAGGWDKPYLGPRKLQAPSLRYNLTADFVLIVNVLCSLLALVLIFDAVCGEAEKGTLRVILAGPTPRDTIITTKLAAGLLTLLVPLAIAWLLSLAYAVAVGRVSFSPEQMLRIGAMAGLSACYVTFFFALGMVLSTWCRRSATSLAAALFLWVALVLIVPNLAPLVAARIAPAAAQSKLELEKQAITSEIRRDLVPKWQDELSKVQRYRERPWAIWQEEILPRTQAEQARREDKLQKSAAARLQRQVDVCRALGRVSPSVAYQYAACGLAGTGIADFFTLAGDFDAYHLAYQQAAAELEAKGQKADRDSRERAPGTDFSGKVPRFEATTVPLGRAAAHTLLDFAWLAGGAVVLFVLAFAGFLRYDPR